jgi:hypothetical protein
MFCWVLAPCRLIGRCQCFGKIYCFHLQSWRPQNPHSKVTDYRLGDRGSVPDKDRNISLRHHKQTGSGAHSASLLLGWRGGGSFQSDRWPEYNSVHKIFLNSYKYFAVPDRALCRYIYAKRHKSNINNYFEHPISLAVIGSRSRRITFANIKVRH